MYRDNYAASDLAREIEDLLDQIDHRVDRLEIGGRVLYARHATRRKAEREVRRLTEAGDKAIVIEARSRDEKAERIWYVLRDTVTA